MKTRDFQGYFQSLNHYNGRGRWQFEISGFDGDYAEIYRSDMTIERVPIDAKGTILVAGKHWTPLHWHH